MQKISNKSRKMSKKENFSIFFNFYPRFVASDPQFGHQGPNSFMLRIALLLDYDYSKFQNFRPKSPVVMMSQNRPKSHFLTFFEISRNFNLDFKAEGGKKSECDKGMI